MWKPRKRHELTRTKLYDLVWSEPVYKVAKRFGISGTGLAKICRNASIPLPERGYWNRVQAGKKVYKRPLKPVAAGKSVTLFITQGDGPRPPRPPEPDVEPEILRAIESESLEKNRIVVPEIVTRLHPEVKKIADASQYRRPWNERNSKPEPIELRRRRIIHAFFRAVEARHGTVSAKPYDRGFEVTLLGSEFVMSCTEPEKRVRVPMTREELKKRSEWQTKDYTTLSQRTGILRMRVIWGADHHKDFIDKSDALLETRLNDVMIYLFQHSISEAERDRRAEAARVAAAEAAVRAAEAERRRWKVEDARRREKERVAALVDRAERWRNACQIRAFVDAATEKDGYATESWLTWAHSVADRMDPLASNEDPDPPPARNWWTHDEDVVDEIETALP